MALATTRGCSGFHPLVFAGLAAPHFAHEAAVKTAVFLQKVGQVEDLADYARLTGLE